MKTRNRILAAVAALSFCTGAPAYEDGLLGASFLAAPEPGDEPTIETTLGGLLEVVRELRPLKDGEAPGAFDELAAACPDEPVLAWLGSSGRSAKGGTGDLLGSVPPLLLRVGRFRGPSPSAPDQGHRIELSGPVAARFLELGLTRQGVVGKPITLDYSVKGIANRKAEMTFDEAAVTVARGRVSVDLHLQGFAPVVTEDRGFNFESNRWISLWMRPSAGSAPGTLAIEGGLYGKLKISDGCFGLAADALTSILQKMMPMLAGRLSDLAEKGLSSFVAVRKPGSVDLEQVEVGSVLGLTSIAAKLKPFEVDLARTLKGPTGETLAAKLRDLRIDGDVVVLELE